MAPIRVERLSGGDRGYIVDFRTMGHPDHYEEDIMVAVIVWDTGSITTETLDGLLSTERIGKEE